MDTRILMFFQMLRSHSTFLLPFFTFLYRLQGFWLIAAAFILYWSIDKTAGRKLIRLYTITMLLEHTLHIFSCRPRPWLRNKQIVVSESVKNAAAGFSTPELTTARTGSLTFGGAVAVGSKRLLLVAVLLTALSAFSGLYIGVCGFLDVLSALEINALVLLTFMVLPASLQENTKLVKVLRYVGIVICTVLMFYAAVKAYPHIYDGEQLAVDPTQVTRNLCASAGLVVGYICGMILEDNLVHYEIPQNYRYRILISVFGTVFSLILYFLLTFASNHLLPEALGGFWSAMLSMVFACAGIPALIPKFSCTN